MLGGAVGGFIGGSVGKMFDPCASAGDIAWAGTKSAGVGALTGFMGGGLATAAQGVAGTGEVAAGVAGSMATAPIDWGLGKL